MKKIIIFLMITILLVSCGDNNNAVNNNEQIVNNNTDSTVDESVDQKDLDITGHYEGSIKVPSAPLPFTADLTYDGVLTGTIDIAIQGVYDIEIHDTKVEGENVYFKASVGANDITFDGVFRDNMIGGTFEQQGLEYAFEINKTEQIVYENRESVELMNGEIKLHGELIVPVTEAEMPVVLIIAGSGPTDLNGNSAAGVSANTYLYLAEALEKSGIASLRYNKRILGNPVSEANLSFDDFIDDAKVLTELLKEDERFSKVYVMGHSQGALIAEVVAKDLDIDGAILLTGAGNTIDSVVLDQIRPSMDTETYETAEMIFEALSKGEVVTDVPTALQSLLRESIQPFFTSWMKYDPVEVLNDIDEPVLIVVGTDDIQVAESEGEAFALSDKSYDYLVVEGMNHLLKNVGSDLNANYASYQNPDLPIHEDLVNKLIIFIKQ